MLQKIKSWLSQKNEVNYLYFSILFVILSIFSLYHLVFLEQPLWGVRIFFFLYSAGQALLEVWTFIFIAYSLKRFAPRWTYALFIAFSFIVLLVHFTDFTLLRLMDTPVSYVFKFLFGQGFDHLFTAFSALNMNVEMIALIFLAIIAIPCFGVFLYWGTSRLARFMPWTLSQGQIALIIITIGGALLLLEILVHPYLDRSAYDKFQKTLPLGATFLSPTPRCIELTRPIASFRDENEIREKLPILKAKRLPNIYFFVIETFRKDFVNSETAPNLLAFAEKNINISSSFANANWTALSWFALFQSSFPYDWTAIRDHWTGGSIPLQLLKKMGYQIHTYSAADLHYFNLDQVIFGKNRELADSIEDYSTDRTLEPCDRDARCISSFAKKLAKKEGKTGNVYLFFFDGTHSEYSFPKDFPLRFTPIVKQIDYLTVNAKEIEPIKNRYRNAIAHIDTLLGNFFHLLKCEGVYDDAVIAITGDHGEEFYEEGALFHGTHLNRYQLEVPIICKFGKLRPTISEATHIDLFPSILHHISKVDSFDSLFDGRSLLSSKKRSPYRIAVLQNGPDTPFEFAIEKKNGHLQLRFLDPKNIYQQTKLEVISLQVDGKIPECSLEETLETTFPNALNLLFRE